MAARLSDEELERIETLVTEALESGDDGRLPVLGYGEISLVLGWPAERPAFACKRLPPFPSRERFAAYRDALGAYLDALAEGGVRVVPTELREVDMREGAVAGYVVQPMLPAQELAPAVLRGSEPREGHPLVEALATTVAATVGPRVGLDAQLSNWIWDGSALTYFDVSTPLIWSEDGICRLDVNLLAEAYPAVLRWPLRRFVAPGILDTYRDLRKVYLDFAGNLLKERLDPWLPRFLEAFNVRIESPLTEREVRRYYRSDKLLWAALLRIRRMDRAWRRKVRRRPYPFLLPGPIER
jgi:hypothetical protein